MVQAADPNPDGAGYRAVRVLRFAWFAIRAVRFLWAWCALPPLARSSVLEMLVSINGSAGRIWDQHYQPPSELPMTRVQWMGLVSEKTPGVEFLYRAEGARGAVDVLYGDL